MDDNFKCIYKILRALKKLMDYTEFELSQIDYHKLEISKERWARYLGKHRLNHFTHLVRIFSAGMPKKSDCTICANDLI